MRKFILAAIILSISNIVFAQDKLSLMQGIWADIYNGENEYNEFSFTITKGHKSLSFGYAMGESPRLTLWETIDGFLNYNPVSKGVLDVNTLQDDGEYYVSADVEYINDKGIIEYPNFLVPDYFEIDANNMSIGGNKLVEFIKIERLPSFALKLLYNRGKKDDKDYIEKYLDIKVKEVQVDKSIIYSEPGTATKMFLIKGDVATVLEEKGDWLKIEFLGKRLVTGWIKKKDVN